jgi:hypothetical protein
MYRRGMFLVRGVVRKGQDVARTGKQQVEFWVASSNTLDPVLNCDDEKTKLCAWFYIHYN